MIDYKYKYKITLYLDFFKCCEIHEKKFVIVEKHRTWFW